MRPGIAHPFSLSVSFLTLLKYISQDKVRIVTLLLPLLAQPNSSLQHFQWVQLETGRRNNNSPTWAPQTLLGRLNFKTTNLSNSSTYLKEHSTCNVLYRIRKKSTSSFPTPQSQAPAQVGMTTQNWPILYFFFCSDILHSQRGGVKFKAQCFLKQKCSKWLLTEVQTKHKLLLNSPCSPAGISRAPSPWPPPWYTTRGH